jgi:hypothetical protein
MFAPASTTGEEFRVTERTTGLAALDCCTCCTGTVATASEPTSTAGTAEKRKTANPTPTIATKINHVFIACTSLKVAGV